MEILTVCVDFRRFLPTFVKYNNVLPINVITASHDKATQRYCKTHNINFYVTDVFYKNKCPFNKGAAINEWLELRQGNLDWILHLDCDTLLPPNFLNLTKEVGIEIDTYYGCRRRHFQNWRPDMEITSINSYPMWQQEEGYAGFLQLFNLNSNCLKFHPIYPVHHFSAAVSDDEFGKKFSKSMFINTEVLHLGRVHSSWYGARGRVLI